MKVLKILIVLMIDALLIATGLQKVLNIPEWLGVELIRISTLLFILLLVYMTGTMQQIVDHFKGETKGWKLRRKRPKPSYLRLQ
jgi:hypothetical protein